MVPMSVFVRLQETKERRQRIYRSRLAAVIRRQLDAMRWTESELREAWGNMSYWGEPEESWLVTIVQYAAYLFLAVLIFIGLTSVG